MLRTQNLGVIDPTHDMDRMTDTDSALEDPLNQYSKIVDPLHSAPFFISQSTLEKLFLQRPLIVKVRRSCKTEYVDETSIVEYKIGEDKDKKGVHIQLDPVKDGL